MRLQTQEIKLLQEKINLLVARIFGSKSEVSARQKGRTGLLLEELPDTPQEIQAAA